MGGRIWLRRPGICLTIIGGRTHSVFQHALQSFLLLLLVPIIFLLVFLLVVGLTASSRVSLSEDTGVLHFFIPFVGFASDHLKYVLPSHLPIPLPFQLSLQFPGFVFNFCCDLVLINFAGVLLKCIGSLVHPSIPLDVGRKLIKLLPIVFLIQLLHFVLVVVVKLEFH